MKIINSGSTEIKFMTQGNLIVLKHLETADVDERTFSVLKKIFPALEAVEEKVVIESKPQPIETKPKAKKNGTSKKSK